MKPQFFHLL